MKGPGDLIPHTPKEPCPPSPIAPLLFCWQQLWQERGKDETQGWGEQQVAL